MQNKIRHIIRLILWIILATSCTRDSNKTSSKNSGSIELSFSDSLWISFRDSMVNHRIDYLLKNSFDSIECIDCLADSLKTANEIYDSRFIFINHLTQLMHLDNLDKNDFSTYQNDSSIYVSYSIKWKYAEEGAYGLHYRFKKLDDKYLFSGMFTTP